MLKMELGISGTLFLAVCISLVIYLFQWKRRMRWKGMPPGPPALPLVGSMLHVMTKDMTKTVEKLSRQYGPVFTIYMANQPAVVLVGYECIKEALVDRSDAFSARGNSDSSDLLFKDYGVMLSNGERWKQMRRFTLGTLRNFGMGKKSLEKRIQEEACCLGEGFSKNGDSPFDPTDMLRLAVSNVIFSVVFGERYEYEDKTFMTMLFLLKELFLILASPWGMLLHFFPKILPRLPGPHQKIFKNMDRLKEFIRQSVENHKKTMDVNCPRDFIDSFLIKMEEEKDNPNTEFHFDNLYGTVIDLFFAGVETTSNTLTIAFLVLLKHSQMARKIQDEMDNVVGQSRCPSVEDRIKMPYTDAVLHEIHRFANIVPMGVPRATSKDTEFRGYKIPKGTMIFPTLTSVLKDEKYFIKPDEFDPGHFLDESGYFKNSEAFLPFAIGKRSCLGENLARMQIFHFITTILHRYNLKSNKALEEIEITPEPGLNASIPHTYQMYVESRY